MKVRARSRRTGCPARTGALRKLQMRAEEEWAYAERCAGLRDDDVLGLEELAG